MDTRTVHLLGRYILVAALIVVLLPRLLALAHPTEGRYQVAGIGANSFVLDTSTGRMWSRYVPPDSGPAQWVEVEAAPPAAGSK